MNNEIMLIVILLFLLIYLCFREREREGGGVRGRGGERNLNRLHAGHGARSHDPKISLKIMT